VVKHTLRFLKRQGKLGRREIFQHCFSEFTSDSSPVLVSCQFGNSKASLTFPTDVRVGSFGKNMQAAAVSGFHYDFLGPVPPEDADGAGWEIMAETLRR
jgi:hypothetical protein